MDSVTLEAVNPDVPTSKWDIIRKIFNDEISKGRMSDVKIDERKSEITITFGNLNVDKAAVVPKGGIDFNSANMAMIIKRDGHGVPLPLAQQDMSQLSKLEGFFPEVLQIIPAVDLPIIVELKQKLHL